MIISVIIIVTKSAFYKIFIFEQVIKMSFE
jgi:hypothetical protein